MVLPEPCLQPRVFRGYFGGSKALRQEAALPYRCCDLAEGPLEDEDAFLRMVHQVGQDDRVPASTLKYPTYGSRTGQETE
jgi:hypothetical protein